MPEDALDVRLVSGNIIRGQENSTAGQAGFHGVVSHFGFSRA